MKQPAKRIITAAISLLATLAVLLAGYGFYNNYIVNRPLLQALKDIDGVQAVDMEKAEGEYRIKVVLDGVDDLPSVYRQLDEAAAGHLGKRDYELQIAGQQNPQLTELYNRLQPYLYEALAKNEYIWLQEAISGQIRSSSPDTQYGFFIDSERIYLQLTQEQKSVYAVIPRQLSEGAVSI